MMSLSTSNVAFTCSLLTNATLHRALRQRMYHPVGLPSIVSKIIPIPCDLVCRVKGGEITLSCHLKKKKKYWAKLHRSVSFYSASQ